MSPGVMITRILDCLVFALVCRDKRVELVGRCCLALLLPHIAVTGVALALHSPYNVASQP